MLYGHSFLILLGSIISGLISEALSWFLVYRTDDYQRLTKQIEKTAEKLKKEQETVKSKGKDVKVKLLQEKRAEEERDLTFLKMRSMLAVTATMGIFVGLLYSWFDGKVVARLPFIPFPLVQKLSHRNLIGDDYTECSMVFLFILCSMAVRPSIQKLFGHSQPKTSTPSLFSSFSQS